MHAVRIPTEHVSTTEEHADIPSAPDNVPDCKLFKWGDYDSQVYEQNLDIVYDKVVFWRQNLFKFPSGAAGKAYVKETTRLVAAWNSNSNLMDIAWKCIMIMPALLLQKPAANSKSRDHREALSRRLGLWQKGNLLELFREAVTIQKRLKSNTPSRNIDVISKKFSSLMKAGKLNAAIKLLSSNMEGGILPLSEETMALLKEKHPEPAEISLDAIIDKVPEEIHPIEFDGIDGESIRKATIKTKGGAGPSGMDADGWRHLLISKNFKEANEELREQLAICTKKLATEKWKYSQEMNIPLQI